MGQIQKARKTGWKALPEWQDLENNPRPLEGNQPDLFWPGLLEELQVPELPRQTKGGHERQDVRTESL